MFRNCFKQSFIRFLVLIVLGNQCQRVAGDRNYGVFKQNDLEHPRPIYDRSSKPETKHRVPDGDFVGVEREAIVAGDSPEHGRDVGPTNNAGTDPVTETRTETLEHAPRLSVSPRETRIRTGLVRKRRQMVEYYVDGTDGIIETRPSHKGQYHVVLGGKSSKEESAAEERDVRDTFDEEETVEKENAYRPILVDDDDNGEAEDVFFREARDGQNRDALNLFLPRSKRRSKRSAETDSQHPGQNRRHHDVISSVNDVPDTAAKLLTVEYKESGNAGQRKAEQAPLPNRSKNLWDFGNSSTENAKTTLLRRIVEAILKNETIASYLEEASRRSNRSKRQILEYFVDSITGRIDKRDTNRGQASTKDRTAKHRVSTSHKHVEELARNAYENDKRIQRGFNGRNSADETGRSVDNDSDDLEDVLQNRARGLDDVNSNVRRHNYAISDDIAESDDERNFDKRRLAYEDPPPSDDEDDFYYVEESNLVKREAGQTNEKLDNEFKDSVREEDVPNCSASQEECKLLSKELIELMIKEIDDRLQGKPGNPELQVRRPSSVAKQQETDKTENPEMPKLQNDSPSSVADQKKSLPSKVRKKRRASHRSESTDEMKRRSAKLEDDLDKLEAERKLTEERLEQSKKRSPGDDDADEKADDLDMTKQIVAIIIEHAVRQMRTLASSGSSAKQLEQPEPKSRGQGAVLGPPPVVPIQTPPQTTPLTYWDVEPIPKSEMAKDLLNTSDEYFADGFRFQQVTYPSVEVHPKSTDVRSQPKRRQRRQRWIEDDRFVRAVDDFSSSAVKTRTGQQVLDGIESATFCRVIHHLVDQGKLSRESYQELVDNKTCFKYPAPYRNRVRRGLFRIATPAPCQFTNGRVECGGEIMTLPPVDLLTGGITDSRCEELTYMATYPSVFNVYRGQVTTRIPMSVIFDYGGYAWGGIGTGIQPPAEPPKRNGVWGVLFAFTFPFRLWGMRFIETPPTAHSVLSIAVYLQHFDDTEKRWTPVTEDGSREPQIIPATSALINFTEIHTVTGILIFLQEWIGKPMLPHPIFITCSAESSLESNDTLYLPISRTSSWETILKGIARDSKTYETSLHKGHEQ